LIPDYIPSIFKSISIGISCLTTVRKLDMVWLILDRLQRNDGICLGLHGMNHGITYNDADY
jgi:hypothetical protein